MKKVVSNKTSESVISQEEIDTALQDIYKLFSRFPATQENNKENLKEVEDDKHYLTLPSGLKIKTVFHSVEVEMEDMFGGKFSCIYEIRPTVEKIADFLKTMFPKTSQEQIAEVAETLGESYEEVKNKFIFEFAERIFDGRMAIGRFFHDELKKILKIVINDLVTDAELYSLSQFDYKLASASEFDKKRSKEYEKARKQRIKVISRKGRPQGKSLSPKEFEKTIEQIENAFRELESKKQKITKTAVAEKLYVGQNLVQKLNRFFKSYDFVTYDELLQSYRKKREN